jgi:hypothetical protein
MTSKIALFLNCSLAGMVCFLHTLILVNSLGVTSKRDTPLETYDLIGQLISTITEVLHTSATTKYVSYALSLSIKFIYSVGRIFLTAIAIFSLSFGRSLLWR